MIHDDAWLASYNLFSVTWSHLIKLECKINCCISREKYQYKTRMALDSIPFLRTQLHHWFHFLIWKSFFAHLLASPMLLWLDYFSDVVPPSSLQPSPNLDFTRALETLYTSHQSSWSIPLQVKVDNLKTLKLQHVPELIHCSTYGRQYYHLPSYLLTGIC